MRRMIPGLFAALAVSAFLLPTVAQSAGKLYRIGFLTGVPLTGAPVWKEAFREGLRERGYVEGKNIAIEWRSHAGVNSRRPALVADLVRRRVDVIVASGSTNIRAVKKATATIPIVMVGSGDPVATGLVASLARPGGNVTGLSMSRPEIAAKQLSILKEALPGISRVAVFLFRMGTDYTQIRARLDGTAKALGMTLQYLDINAAADIETAFRAAVEGRAEAVLFRVARPLFVRRRPWLMELAAKSGLPVIYEWEPEVEAGGLMSYTVDRPGLYRHVAAYVDKILRGAKPADLPVEQPMRFKLTVNLKTAKAQGISIPRSILLRADRVIE